MIRLALLLSASLLGQTVLCQSLPVIRVGSKSFTESYILAEIVSQVIERTGEARVERRFGLGQTGIAFTALEESKIDVIPEYSGTIAENLLHRPELRDEPALRKALEPLGLVISGSLGFENKYALAVNPSRWNLSTLTDLAEHPELHAGFSHEFLHRTDGLPRLRQVYDMRFRDARALEHSLAYSALRDGVIDVTDVYTTDARLEADRLRTLIDDKHAFPPYRAVILARASLPGLYPRTWSALRALEGRISEGEMRKLNASVELGRIDFGAAARGFLGDSTTKAKRHEMPWLAETRRLTWQHLELVLISLCFSVVAGIPLAIAASHHRRLAHWILGFSEVVQTIPSLALLCFLIPLFGIGTRPALVALFLYGLLPIVRGTYAGLLAIDPQLREISRALAIPPMKRLLLVELPLASPNIMSGVKTSAVINVGTATLAALIGAGGYGVPIVTGLALNDNSMILRGAIPAALMALAAHWFFEWLDGVIIPKGLRA